MPSLKDLRNRIAATKATQKITKAMQMVAASKLRRAQAAAEAARPYAIQHGQGARQYRRLGRQPRHRAAIVARQRRRQSACGSRLHRRAQAVSPVQHRDGAARPRARRQRCRRPRARTCRHFCVGRRAEISCAGSTAAQSSKWSTCTRVWSLFIRCTPRVNAEKSLRCCDAFEFEVSALFFSFFRLVHAPIQAPRCKSFTPLFQTYPPPAPASGGGWGCGSSPCSELKPVEEEVLAKLFPRNMAVLEVFRALMENVASFYEHADVPRWTTRP